MSICASCGRRVDAPEPSRTVCPSCTWRAALRVSQTTTVVDRGNVETPVAMAARLHELAVMAGERLTPNSVDVLEAVARGNARVYEAEVTRLAHRFVQRLEETWKP